MSHLTRVLLLFPLLLLCTSSLPAQIHPSAQTVNVITHYTATELRDLCREYIAIFDGTAPENPIKGVKSGQCMGYILGAIDGLNLEMAAGVGPKSLKACVPKTATMDELVRIFLKFIDIHPEQLHHTAAGVAWN